MGVSIGGAFDMIRNNPNFFRNFGKFSSHESFDGRDGFFRIGHRLPFGRLTDQHLSIFGEGDDRWSKARALFIMDYLRLSPLHDGDDRVGRSKINSYHFSHSYLLILRFFLKVTPLQTSLYMRVG